MVQIMKDKYHYKHLHTNNWVKYLPPKSKQIDKLINAWSDGKISQVVFVIKGPYADHILIPQGSTASSIFFDIKWKPLFF